MAASSLLLVTHVPIRSAASGPQIDDQTAAGIAQWCRHFDSVTFYGTAADASAAGGSTNWVDTGTGALAGKARLIALPRAYGVTKMARHHRAVRTELRRAIAAHRHLCFTIGGIIGDWPAVGALEAIRQKRDYAAWLDRVEPLIIRNKLASAPLKTRIAGTLALPVLERVARHILRRSSVALLQGGDTFDYYANSAPNPHVTYDTHTHVEDQISAQALAGKQARCRSGAPLRILYVGRAAAMKGPFDWIEVLATLAKRQVPFEATWIGDGPDLPEMRSRASTLGLGDRVRFPGFENRRDALLEQMRANDLLLFCHKTPESARCLIESLVSGCPIVGYGSAYPRGLVADRGGGVFVSQNDVTGLADRLAALHADREALARLIAEAAASGGRYNEDAVYAHRAALMRQG
jgi:colanic acid/amylovoran biosynthesis glycosyltransferase